MMEMSNQIPIIYKDKSLSPFVFFTEFLLDVANFYAEQKNKDNPIEFKLIEGNDLEFTRKKYYVDPITLPLLLSLFQQLKYYHNKPIKLHLSNTLITIDILEYLYRSQFFYITGDNVNPNFPLGRQILDFDNIYLGGFKSKSIRTEHKLRCYSLNDENLKESLTGITEGEPAKRDYLVEFYTYKVKEHFYDLLFENETTSHLTNEFIEILAELITNGVLHSKSDAFVLMFSDKFKTKFSISDNGIGLYDSLNNKKDASAFYEKFELLKSLSRSFPLKIDEKIKNSVLILFETLYYSMLKDRQGLFDLMCNVVLDCSGYFRLHTDNAQIIVSARMLNELDNLYHTRIQILSTHHSLLFGKIKNEDFKETMTNLKEICKKQISELAGSIFKKYSEDTRFSALRIFEVRFKGVHIEVEIPNSIEKV
jgi:hypothetical protein